MECCVPPHCHHCGGPKHKLTQQSIYENRTKPFLFLLSIFLDIGYLLLTLYNVFCTKYLLDEEFFKEFPLAIRYKNACCMIEFGNSLKRGKSYDTNTKQNLLCAMLD